MPINQAALFVSHGAPDLVIRDIPAARFLRNLFSQRPKPDAILVLSAHWETRGISLTTAKDLNTIYDFGGFDRELYRIKYPVNSSAKLIDQVTELLASADIPVNLEPKRGLDHGVWAPLKLMFPAADIPVVQMSIDRDRSPAQLMELGQTLAPLAEQNVLILGSGASVHNLRYLSPQGSPPPQWAIDFDQWTNKIITEGNWQELCRFKEQHLGSLAHPTPEHFLPLIFASGTIAGKSPGNIKGNFSKRLHFSYSYGTIGMSAWEFNNKAYF